MQSSRKLTLLPLLHCQLLNMFLSVIEKEAPSDVGQQSQYQGVPVSKVEQSKAAINGLVRRNVNAINESLANHYGSLADGTKAESSKTQEADELAHVEVKVLNSRVWMKDATEESLTIQLNPISKVVNAFNELQPLRLTNEEQLKEQYVMLVQWATTYFCSWSDQSYRAVAMIKKSKARWGKGTVGSYWAVSTVAQTAMQCASPSSVLTGETG